jgi:hypothetical protein
MLMSFKYSTGFKNDVLDTGSVKATFADMVIIVYSGAVPATADEATGSAVPLLTFTDGGGAGGLDLAASAASGVIEKLSTQTWQGVAVADGTPSFFRAETSSDDQSASTSYKRIQGTVGVTGADLNMSSATIVNGDTYNLDYFVLEFMNG